MAARRRESSISFSMRRTDSASRTVSSAPMGAPRSEMKSSESCTRRPCSISISRAGTSWRSAKASSTMRPSRLESSKTSSTMLPSISPRGTSDEALGRGADQHDAAVAGEQHEAVLQGGHELIEVFLQGGEDLAHIVDLPAQAVDAVADRAEFVGAFRAPARAFRLSVVMASRRRAIASSGRSARLERNAAMNSESSSATAGEQQRAIELRHQLAA